MKPGTERRMDLLQSRITFHNHSREHLKYHNMETQLEKESTLHDLVHIHHERLAAYAQIKKWLADERLFALINDLYQQSQLFMLELRTCLHSGLPDPAGRTELLGELYHQWNGIPKIKPGCNEYELVVFCEENEKSACVVYHNLLDEQPSCSGEVHDLISTQLDKLDKNIELVKHYKLIALNAIVEHQHTGIRS